MNDDPASTELADMRRQLDDATQERDAQAEREKLLRGELQYRVRNTLAMVRSIFARTVAASGSIDELTAHFEGRLNTLSRYHALHGAEPGGAVDLEMMVHDELSSVVAAGDSRVRVEGAEVLLPHHAAQLFGLALHELATNSIKFGVLGSSESRAALAVTWHVQGGILTFCWEESGIRILAAAPQRAGFGHGFIKQALPYQLDAQSAIELRPGGLLCRIDLPLSGSNTSARPISF